jgi:peptide/nickel transport system substrate-binding protein
MRRKHVLSLFMLSMGVTLLIAATTVGVASSATQTAKAAAAGGGILKINQSGGTFDSLDPQIAYVSNDWQVTDATQMLLLNYPDKSGAAGNQIVPEAAKAFPTISRGGTVYTYHLKSGLRFNDGSKVTAAAFQRPFERVLSPQMFDQLGLYDGLDVDLVGGQAFAESGAYAHDKNGGCGAGAGPKCSMHPPQHIAGIKAKGLTLTLHLTRRVPYLESLLAMQWFGAIKPNMPYSKSKSGLLTYASAGPYYIASNNLNGYTILKRNKYYHGGRPAYSKEIQIHNLTDIDTSMLEIQKGQVNTDLGFVPAQDAGSYGQKYGVNKKNGQFHVGTTTCIDWINFNTARGATANPQVRKALNYALGRNELINILGAYSGTAADGILPPGVSGYQKLKLYPNNPDPAKAKTIGGAALRGASLDLYYNALSPNRTHQAELMQSELTAVGAKVTMDPESTGDYYGPLETKGTKYNVSRGGWCADYFDPFDYINVNFDGRSIQPTGNTDYTYFNSAAFNKKMDAAAAKTGKARAKAYAALDKLLMTKYMPAAVYEFDNNRYLSSKNTHNWIYSVYFGGPDINALKVG